MNINFRQGIISSQSLPHFLLRNVNGNVDFDASVNRTILNFADGSSNYLLYETASVKNAWIIPTNHKCWLYWDISTEDASRTFGYTSYSPFSTTAPNDPQLNQMYFDLPTSKYKAWDGQYWRDVIRVIAGVIDEAGNILTQSNGTQINLYQSVVTDIIVYDFTKKPIKNYTETGYEFLNKTTIINFKNTNKDSFKYNRILNSNGVATEAITKHHCVTWDQYNSLQLADPSITNSPAFALAERTVDTGDIVSLCTEGFVTNRTDWNWTNPPHTSLYVGTDGALTPNFDSTFINSFQIVGYIVSPNTIYVNFNNQYTKYVTIPFTTPTTPILSITPTPTYTPTPTPTISPSAPTAGTCGVLSASQVAPLGSSGMINILSQNNDDASFQLGPLPFDFYFNGINYGHGLNGGIYVGSNSYITFGSGSSAYNGFSATTPGKAILIQANDRSVQQLFQNSYTNNQAFVLRYEGNVSSSGVVGSPSLVWELTFYANQKIQLTFGVGNNSGTSGISNGTTFIDTTAYLTNTSYAITDNDGDTGQGLLWTPQLGSILCDSGLMSITPTPTPTVTPTLSPPSPTVTPTPSKFNNYTQPITLRRLNSDGTLDNAYTPVTMYAASTIGIDLIRQVQNNSIYTVISYPGGVELAGNGYTTLTRFNSDGTPDITFPELFSSGAVNQFMQAADGKIYIGGYNGLTTIANGYTDLIQLNSDGTVNTTFTALTFNWLNPSFKVIRAMTQTIDGKIYVGGSFSTINGITYNGLARLNADGTLDTTFVQVSATTVSSILQTSDDKIYIVDGSTFKRLNSDGTLDNTYTPVTMNKSIPSDGMIQTFDGKIYICNAGLTNFGSNTSYHSVFRLNSDGTIDTSFVDVDPNSQIQSPSIMQANNGKIYICNAFNFSTGVNSIVELNSDGTISTNNSPTTGSAQSAIYQTSDDKLYYGQ